MRFIFGHVCPCYLSTFQMSSNAHAALQDYFSERMSGLRADLRVLQKLLSEEIPELAEHLDLQGVAKMGRICGVDGDFDGRK